MKTIALIIALAMAPYLAMVPCFATTYYVAPNGSNSNNGTSVGTPFLTIQKSLDVAIAGDTVNIMAGTYPEALVLKTTGSSSARITVRNYNGASVTVSSGNSKALRAGGRRHYYVFDGLRFITDHMVYDAPYDNDFTLDFKDVIWDGNTTDAGNCGFIVRNCYVEGAIRIYGHGILVENCELNGKSLWRNGIMDGYTSSHDNIYRRNTIYGYKDRGVWSMQYTDNILIEENIIHDIYNPSNGNSIQAGVDCDGAGHPVTRCIVRKNTIYNVGGRLVEMENSFNSVVEDNIGHDSKLMGIHFINYGLGSADFTSDAEHRTTNTNSIVRNNIVYNTTQDGIIIRAAPGTKIYNNTIFNVSGTKGYYGAISLIAYGGYYSHNVDIRNNIVMQGKPWAIYIDQP
ncbi:MAG: right-handed parallel beta-helix repeat-containing protein, partial [Lentimicrobiaceae bacterium]|nr:right-handed parallel beta-helix repeat-containing protein [Lentimicrobiaceae bacterium]